MHSEHRLDSGDYYFIFLGGGISVLRAAAGDITLGDENSGFEWHAPLPLITALVDCTARYLLVPITY
jgi:hypothetical protein